MENNHITVLLAGRPYSLRVKEGDEASIQKIVKEVSHKIEVFKTAYPQKDLQDCLVMSLLTYGVELHKSQQQGLENQDIERLQNVDEILSHALLQEHDG